MLAHETAPQPLREFLISRTSRTQYRFDDMLFAMNGDVTFANFHSVRLFVQRLNEKRDLIAYPERSIRASEVNAMGLIHEIMHFMVQRYIEQQGQDVREQFYQTLEGALGKPALDKALVRFADLFPSQPVYHNEVTPEVYVSGTTGSTPQRNLVLEELFLLALTNENPAITLFEELFDDSELRDSTAYPQIITALDGFFDAQPTFGPLQQTLLDMLRSPARVAPGSLSSQLEYIRTQWSGVLGKYLYRLLSSIDFLAEENRAFFDGGPGPMQLPEFGALDHEPEAYSRDLEWMPRVVMLAKNAYVWLDQLTKIYKRPIATLDQIPDEELNRLRDRGFTGLWLIGLWQRSRASQHIKQMMGNPEAVASAYSLDGYAVADEIGGEAAFENLRARAWQRGIRIASDMVPNHVGIDSPWVIEHPEWFISLPQSPFPSYTFNGPDLSSDGRVGIRLEDHYYTRNDAAVVFQRTDRWTGDTRYIYHGNDGTMMAWNDTAQLNYLNPEVREAVIQTILSVARRSPIIRFDAAMTLTKRHYQRLWFPEPGSGGDIPSRAGLGLTKAQFDAAMPQEFWREVVDRVAAEAPDTLLLAEAFWLMEGYFVRTLGMHRVYNSAFMNMLRDEKNDGYRTLIKTTLEFDPEILKRYVNFMNNPDERTATDQFGKGDKYFGICTLMATMPGLPMFGHGQIEGFAEKYGMEYRRAYWDETPDGYLIERHERQVFPLLHKRYLFAGVEHFRLYDFRTPEGAVDENVFAYTNRVGDERALVIYHNRYAETRGWIHHSTAYAEKAGGSEKQIRTTSLAERLGVSHRDDAYVVFRDQASNLEYIRSSAQLSQKGLYAQLNAYQLHVFVDFREVQESHDRPYGRLCAYLDGSGVPNIEEALSELFLAPVHGPLRTVVNAAMFQQLQSQYLSAEEAPLDPEVLDETEQKLTAFLAVLQTASHATQDAAPVTEAVIKELKAALSLPALVEEHHPLQSSPTYDAAVDYLLAGVEDLSVGGWASAFGWLFTHQLGALADPQHAQEISRSWIDEFQMGKVIRETVETLGLPAEDAERAVATVKMLVSAPALPVPDSTQDSGGYALMTQALTLADVRSYLGVNRHRETLWFNKEAFETFVWWMVWRTSVALAQGPSQAFASGLVAAHRLAGMLLAAAKYSGYQVDRLVNALRNVSA